jgi:hypothetical protein
MAALLTVCLSHLVFRHSILDNNRTGDSQTGVFVTFVSWSICRATVLFIVTFVALAVITVYVTFFVRIVVPLCAVPLKFARRTSCRIGRLVRLFPALLCVRYTGALTFMVVQAYVGCAATERRGYSYPNDAAEVSVTFIACDLNGLPHRHSPIVRRELSASASMSPTHSVDSEAMAARRRNFRLTKFFGEKVGIYRPCPPCTRVLLLLPALSHARMAHTSPPCHTTRSARSRCSRSRTRVSMTHRSLTHARKRKRALDASSCAEATPWLISGAAMYIVVCASAAAPL